MTKHYIYRAYPAYRYHKTEEPVIVKNEAEDKKLLDEGWKKTPKDLVMDKVANLGFDEKQLKEVEKAVDGIAAATNMVMRVKKARSKKSLYDLADLLEIDVDEKATLKELKAHIIAEAAKGDGLKEMIGDDNSKEHSN